MAHQCIKYRLNPNGTVPDCLYLGEDGVGGAYVVGDPFMPSPLDMVMIGISVKDPVGYFEVVPSQQALQDYLAQVGANWVTPGEKPDDPPVPFDPAAAAAYVWGRLTALNGG